MIKLKDIITESNAIYLNLLYATQNLLKRNPDAESEANQFKVSIGKSAETPLNQLDMGELTKLNILIHKYLSGKTGEHFDSIVDTAAEEAAAKAVADATNKVIAKYYSDKGPGAFTGD